MLSGLLMGFRTVAIEKRSAEVWQTLGAVKTQFGKFSELLEGVQKKLHVIDGEVIKGRPADLAKASKKPILIGTCSQEGDAFICNIPTALLPLAAHWFSFKLHPGKNARRRMSDDFTAAFYTNPSREIAREIKGPSWVYEYRYMTPDIEKRGAGCFHASDIPVLFGKSTSYANVDDPVSRRVGEKMREIWSAFAYKGEAPWAQFKEDEEVFGIK